MCLPPNGQVRFDKGIDTSTFLGDRLDWMIQICPDPADIDGVDPCPISVVPNVHGQRIIDALTISEEPNGCIGG